MRYANQNTSALMASLQCSLPDMRATATRVVQGAIEHHATLAEAAETLGVSLRAIHKLKDLAGGTEAEEPSTIAGRNSRALKSALQCSIPEMRDAARQLLSTTFEEHDYTQDAAAALGVPRTTGSTLRRMLDELE